jgi:hypothetical protein
MPVDEMIIRFDRDPECGVDLEYSTNSSSSSEISVSNGVWLSVSSGMDGQSSG